MDHSSSSESSISSTHETGLFAAVCSSDINQDKFDKQSTNPQSSWLYNESFNKDANEINKLEDQKTSTIEQDERHKKRKHKKEKKKKSKKSRTRSPERSSSNRKHKKDHSNDKHNKNYLKEKEETSKQNYSKTQLQELINKDDNLFKIDKKYVKDNLFYDSLYAGDVPKYKIYQPKILKSKNKVQRYFSTKLMNVDQQIDYNQLVVKKKTFTFNNSEDFIKLTSTESNEQPVKQELQLNQEQKDESLKDEINYENQELFNRIKQFNSYLNLNPNDIDKWIQFVQFQDELIFELDNDELRVDLSKKEENVNLIEKKLLVLDKALKSNPTNIKLMIMKLELLKNTKDPEELNKEWEKMVFTHATNFEIMKNYMKFIITHISFFNVGNLNKFFDKYMIKIVQYQEGHFKSIRDSINDVSNLEKSMLELLLFYTIILKQCGFIERSLSIWQSLIDFNFNKPDFLNLEHSLEDWKDYFEIYWSSGEARFGEKGTIGWKNVLDKNKNKDNVNKPESNESKLKKINDEENEIVQKYTDSNRIWFQIELLREKFNWMPVKLHEDSVDADDCAKVVFDNISTCLFRFKDQTSYQTCLLYFLCFLDAIQIKLVNNEKLNFLSNELVDKLNLKLPIVYLDHEERIWNCKNLDHLTPKYFSYDQKIRFSISVFQQSLSLIEHRNSNDYHQLVNYYLSFIIQNIRQLGSEQSRKLFKQILKKPSNCNQIGFWKRFVELEVELNELTSAKKIYNQILGMLINQQVNEKLSDNSTEQFIIENNLSLIHDFIEFNLKIGKIKDRSLIMVDCLKVDDFKKEKEISETILIFIYSILNSRTFQNIKEINCPLQLRTIQKIEKLSNDCFEQVLNIVESDDNDLNCIQQVKRFIYSIVLQIYNCYFHRLLDLLPSDKPNEALEKSSTLINEQLIKIKKIKNQSIVNYLIECIYEKHLDLHLLFLRYNFCGLKSFNKLLYEALEQFPTNNYFLKLLVNTQKTFINGQIEKFTIKLCRKIHQTNLEQWLVVIYSQIQRLVNIQQSISQPFSTNSLSEDLQSSRTIDHTGTCSIGLEIRIRNLFEKALNVHNCLLLWRMYLHFEVNQNNLENAKIIFYRAAQQCPWSKLLYMDGINLFTLINTTTDRTKSKNKRTFIKNVENLNDLLDLMIEKQLRVRTAEEEVQFLINNKEILKSSLSKH